MLTPAAAGGVRLRINISIGQMFLQRAHNVLGNRVILHVVIGVVNPQALQLRQVFQRCPVLDVVEADIEVNQIRQPGKGRNIANLVLENLQILQIRQVRQGGDILHLIAGDNQHAQLGHFREEGNIRRLIMPDVEREHLRAVFEYRKLRTGVRCALVVMERGKRGGIGADEVVANAHRPAKLHLRIACRQHFDILAADFCGEHIYLAHVRQFIQEAAQRVVIRHDILPQINFLRRRGNSQRHEGRRFLRQHRRNHHQQRQHCRHEPFSHLLHRCFRLS